MIYTKAILSNSTRKLLGFEISKLLIAVIVLFNITFRTLSFPVQLKYGTRPKPYTEYTAFN